MFIQRIEKLLTREIEQFTETYNEENDNVIPQDYLDKLVELFTSLSKPKTKPQKKPLEDNDRCIALKKDKTRCNTRKATGEEICNLHKRNGANYGSINDEGYIECEPEDVPSKSKPDTKQSGNQEAKQNVKQSGNQDITVADTCVYFIKKGDKKGSMCGKPTIDQLFCKTHGKNKAVTTEKVVNTESYENVEEIEDDEYIQNIDMNKYSNDNLFGEESENDE